MGGERAFLSFILLTTIVRWFLLATIVGRRLPPPPHNSAKVLGCHISSSHLNSQRIWCDSFSWTDSGLCIYHLTVESSTYYYYITPWEVFTSALPDGFPLKFEWQQIFSSPRTLLGILADFNNAVVWIVSTSVVTSKSFGPCTSRLMTVWRSPIAIGIIITFMFHSFFISLAKVLVLILRLP